MKVYIIQKGCYSDRHIVAVTLDKNKANTLADVFSIHSYSDDVNISEYDTDDYDALSKGYYTYGCSFKNGVLIRIEIVDPEDEYYCGIGDYDMKVIAKDYDQAAKIAYDTYATRESDQVV